MRLTPPLKPVNFLMSMPFTYFNDHRVHGHVRVDVWAQTNFLTEAGLASIVGNSIRADIRNTDADAWNNVTEQVHFFLRHHIEAQLDASSPVGAMINAVSEELIELIETARSDLP
jgi:hypothetical protein